VTSENKRKRRWVGSQLHITIFAALNRDIDDWAKLLGDVVIVTPLLDRLMHHGHLLKFVGKSWRLKESAERLAKTRHTA
jgi:DNA replication protein DnaC